MRIRNAMATTTLFAGCFCAATCLAGGDSLLSAKGKGDAWLGHDASELLMQLRVDGGRVQIREIEDTGETAYTWVTENAAYTETATTGGGMADSMNVFANPQLLNAFAQPKAAETRKIDHPATARCQVTFYANLEGIVSRWEYDGPACWFDIEKPKA